MKNYKEAFNEFPDFLKNKISSFYHTRLAKDWNGKHVLRGLVPDDNAVILTSNDYLSFAYHNEVLIAQQEALRSNANNPIMSAVFFHGDTPQLRAEKRFAEFLSSAEAILCQSGYDANLGLLHTLIEDTEIPVYIDLMAHMSLWDGAKLGGGKLIPFFHNDIDHLERKIMQHGPGIVVVDAIYSTDGSICPLVAMADISHSLGCIMVVDESHSLGTHGPSGKGLVVAYDLVDKVMFRTASLAKAFASRAGIILCPKDFSDMFGVSSKPLIFSSALMSIDFARLNKVLDLVSSDEGDRRRNKLQFNSDFLRKKLQTLGLDIGNSNSQIIALKTGLELNTIRVRDILESHGIFGSPFCSPATAKKRSVLRLSLHSKLTEEDLNRVYHACKNIL